MDLSEWKSHGKPLIVLEWRRRDYALKAIHNLPCKLWIKDPTNKNDKLSWHILEEKIDIVTSINFSDKLRFAIEEYSQ